MPIWSQDACISALALSLLHSLWQGAILGLVGVALTSRLRRSTPDVRYTTYSLLLAAMFTVWLGTFCSLYGASVRTAALPQAQTGIIVLSAVSAPSTAAATPAALWSVSRLQPLFPFLVALWAAGVCVLSLRHLGGLLMLRGMCRAATDSCPQAWTDFAERIAREMGIRRKVLLRCSSRVDVPCAFGIFRSYILLPLGVMAGLTPQQAEALIAHELAHLARHDVLFNAIQVCMETVLFYHPAVRWLSMQVRVAREQRCDDLAIQFLGDRVVYARALFSLEEARAPIPRLALGAKGENSHMSNTHLVTRIQRVLGVSGPERRDPWFKGAIAAGAIAAGLAMLHPVHAFDAAPSGPATALQMARAYKAMVVIDGERYVVSNDVLTPDTEVTVNGKPVRFSGLTVFQQDKLKKAISSKPQNDTVIIMRDVKGGGTDVATVPSLRIAQDIKGAKIELDAIDRDNLAPDTTVTVNGKAQRMSDLTESEQAELKRAFAAIPALPTATLGEAGKTSKGDILFQATQDMRIVMDINGDKIELDTDKLAPDTVVKVNGKSTRFGDLTPTQQKQLQEKVESMPRPVIFKAALPADFPAGLPVGVPTAISLRLAPAVLNVDGTKFEIEDGELTSETAVTVNGKVLRFGDMPVAQQQKLRKAFAEMPHRAINIQRASVAVSSRAIPADAATFFKAGLNINGDEIEIDTPELTADTVVKVNGKSVRFGDLTETQQKQLKEAVSPMTAMPGRPASIMRTVPAGLAVPAVDAIPATPAP